MDALPDCRTNIPLHVFQLVRQGFHVLTYLLGGDFGVNLGGLYVSVTEKPADGFNGYAVRQKYGCGVRVAGDMENDSLCKKKRTDED